VYQKQLGVNPAHVLGKTMPFSLEAERAVLGALLLSDERIGLVEELLVSGDFYTMAHKTLYEAMLSLRHQMKRIDLVTLQDELEKSGQFQAVGGTIYLLSLQEDITAIGFLEQHARIVKEKAVLRSLIQSAATIITNCYQSDQELDAVIDEAEKVIFQLSAQRMSTQFVQLTIWLKKTFARLAELKGGQKGLIGVPTGYEQLDRLTLGFQGGDLIVLAARPSMGKTALALRFAFHAAACGKTVGFFSLEMSAEQLTLRLLSSESGIPHYQIRNASISSQDWIRLTGVAGNLSQAKLFIDDTAMVTIMDIRAKARKLKMEQKLDVLVIDYLQLINSNRVHENRHQEVSEISRSLKALAKELNIPIIALSQLSRAVDSRVDKRPMLSDLRESGAIEQDADVIMFLYRDVVYHADTEHPDLAELIIGKQRNGPTGTVALRFFGETTMFVDAQQE
jgi:replicative DNA helicase